MSEQDLELDVLWGEGKPPAEHAGRDVLLLLDDNNCELRRWRKRALGPQHGRVHVKGYFVLPSNESWHTLFEACKRDGLADE